MVAPFEIYKKNATKIFWKNIWKILSGIPNGLKFASKQKTADFFYRIVSGNFIFQKKYRKCLVRKDAWYLKFDKIAFFNW